MHPAHRAIELALASARHESGLAIEIEAERPMNLGFLLYSVAVDGNRRLERVEAKEVVAFLLGIAVAGSVHKSLTTTPEKP